MRRFVKNLGTLKVSTNDFWKTEFWGTMFRLAFDCIHHDCVQDSMKVTGT